MSNSHKPTYEELDHAVEVLSRTVARLSAQVPVTEPMTSKEKMQLFRMRAFKDAFDRMLSDYMTPPRETRLEITECAIDTEALKLEVRWVFVPVTPAPDEDEEDDS